MLCYGTISLRRNCHVSLVDIGAVALRRACCVWFLACEIFHVSTENCGKFLHYFCSHLCFFVMFHDANNGRMECNLISTFKGFLFCIDGMDFGFFSRSSVNLVMTEGCTENCSRLHLRS